LRKGGDRLTITTRFRVFCGVPEMGSFFPEV
jgi:hypothetical protein